ncbi:MAG: mannose-1-phosphate guanyltransferase, partial [Sphingomonas bacterium]|nr:mannose-1-phosphate guanyltransferase [Sphingomonas bacterium]
MEQRDGGRVRPVILAGGAGTRLWPMSTPERPKHLLPLIGDSSLFEQTL